MSKNAIKIPPYHYIHVLDRNTNVTRLEIGPQTFIRQDHEIISTGDKPTKMIILQPRTYCEIANPVIRDSTGELTRDKHGQVNVKFGEVQYRFFEDYPEPFPLYPKEELSQAPKKLMVVKELTALKIEAIRNFVDNKGEEKNAGDEWLFFGPATYYPRIEEKVVDLVNATVLKDQQAIRLRAKHAFTDKKGIKRKAGEEWLIREKGFYLTDVFEEVLQIQDPIIINETRALHLRATQNFIDVYGKERKAGEEWLITNILSTFHIIDIYEEFVNIVNITILNSKQYCLVLNPYDHKVGKNRLGAVELRKGENSFFLYPGEELQEGIKSIYLLQENEALLLRAKEKIDDHNPGDKWMVYGPSRYIPPVEVEVLEVRRTISLDKNEGIYVKDTREGGVRAVVGQAYMLQAHEELYELSLPEAVEKLLYDQTKTARAKYQLVTYRCPFNSAVQVYDYKKKTSRIVFGPNLVTLGPDEQFTVSKLSGGKPKKPNMITAINVQLGPDFTSDIVVVETSDHAALRLKLSYNWYFRIDKYNQEESEKIFAVKDFIGDLCNSMASKVRSAVAGVDFDTFHKTSARTLRKAVFGVDEATNKIKDELVLSKNNLVVTNVDIQSVEPVDANTRSSLQKTVTLAIEITTKRQEAAARHNAEKLEQEAKGELQKLKIEDESKAEAAKKALLELQAKSEAIKNQGVAIADAKAKAEAEEIKAKSELKNAELKTQAKKLEYESNLAQDIKRKNAELEHQKQMEELEIWKSKESSLIESRKFEEMIAAIGRDTIVAMANAGPEMQAELLSGLGLKGFIMTDGNNPINLFNTAQGLIAGDEKH